MIEGIAKHFKSPLKEYQLSVLIPTWNNLGYLQVCVESILKNSSLPVQIVVIVNEGKDGTVDWLEKRGDIDFVHSKSNIGICYGLNAARSLIKSEYLVYINDDMYVLPNWDSALYDEIQRIGHKGFMLSGTMIEPVNTNNPCVIVKDYGRSINDFREEALLRDCCHFHKEDWSGSMWPPNVLPVDLWDLVGGMSIEYSPGMYSDPDFSKKLIETGVTVFKGVGSSMVYHFGSKTTRKIKKNRGKKIFLLKWGITPKTFTKKILRLGEPYAPSVQIPSLGKTTRLINKLKRIFSTW